MDSDTKKRNLESDRLSNLPDDLIYKILSFNDTIDAIGMSSLSSRWRYIWKSIPYLEFSSDDFSTLRVFSKFIKNVLSGRDNEREVSSVKLKFRGKASQVFVKKVLDYAFSHNVQQLTVTYMIDSKVEFPLSLFSSHSLKHLTLKKAYYESRRGSYWRTSITPTSMWELPALTTLHLDEIALFDDNTDEGIGLISMCVNLKNLTLTRCQIMGSNGFKICHPRLSNAKIERCEASTVCVISPREASTVCVIAPQLKNLIIRGWLGKYQISVPDLAYLLLEDINLNLTADDSHSLEKVDICISSPYNEDPHEVVGLLQRLHSVKSLALNLEILEFLSLHVEVISHQPSPFGNLESLKVYPEKVSKWVPDGRYV